MSLEVTGKVSFIGEEEKVAENMTKRMLVLESEKEANGKQWKETYPFELINKSNLADNLSVGDEVTVAFNINGREYEGKYYTSLRAWSVTKK
ncbi:DUF3127 domain-containing protein [Ornithobacterium rhinotracheale]